MMARRVLRELTVTLVIRPGLDLYKPVAADHSFIAENVSLGRRLFSTAACPATDPPVHRRTRSGTFTRRVPTECARERLSQAEIGWSY